MCAEIAASLRQGMGRLGAPVWHFRCPDSLWEIDSCKSSETANFPSKQPAFSFLYGEKYSLVSKRSGILVKSSCTHRDQRLESLPLLILKT